MLASLFRRNPRRARGPCGLSAHRRARARAAASSPTGACPTRSTAASRLLALHAFLVLNRLKAEHAATAEFAQALFDAMFADLDRALREMGATDLGVGRRVKAMASGFYGRIAAYEKGLADGDARSTRRCGAISSARSRAEPSSAGAGGGYVRRQAAALAGAAGRRPAGRRDSVSRRWRRADANDHPCPNSRGRSSCAPGRRGGAIDIAADADERAALARRFALLSLDRLEAEVRLARLAGGLVRLRPSSRPMWCRNASSRSSRCRPHRGELHVLYGDRPERSARSCSTARPSGRAARGRRCIDIGEAVAQQLSLALDPFPRAPGRLEIGRRCRRAGARIAVAALAQLARS